MRKNQIDMSGTRIERLKVIMMDSKNKKQGVYWICKCDCGNKKSIRGDILRGGRVKSCGCYHRDRSTKHGGSNSRLYNIWQAMKKRCYSNEDYSGKWENYKLNKVIVCDEWKDSFSIFREWAIKNGYKENLTIDRIDNYGNYEPSNCRWVTPKEQSLNRSSNRLVTMNGETKTLTQWSDELGINRSTVNSRINILNWSIEEALTREVNS